MPNAHELLARPPCLGAEFNKDGSRRGSPKAFRGKGKGRKMILGLVLLWGTTGEDPALMVAVARWSDPRALGLGQGEANLQLASA